MNRTRYLRALSAGAAIGLVLASVEASAQAIDFVTIMDESGSMGGEQDFIRQLVPDLDAALAGRGRADNQYGLVGYGAGNPAPRKFPIGGNDLGSVADFVAASNALQTSGGFEDGYDGIDFALNNIAYRQGSDRFLLLVTDEDRDNGKPALTFASIQTALQASNARLFGIVNQQITTPQGQEAMLTDGTNAYVADGQGGFVKVAGVTLLDGGQVRASIVIAAVDAQQAFQEMIGPQFIDIGLQRMLTARRPHIASARMQIVLKGVAQDDATRRNMMRRLVYAPSPEAIASAFIDARAGRVPERLIVEAVFPTALDEGAALDKRQIMSVLAHPLPFDAEPDAERREAIRSAILDSIEMFAAGFSGRIEAEDLRLACDDAQSVHASSGAYASKPDILQQWALAAAVSGSGGISGFYFCGPEAQIGAGLSCAAGRVAARAALRAYKKGAA